jgi:RNA polymerase sigma-70 factor (ECF subfamily)
MLDVKAGDATSFELLLHKYRMPVINFLYRMVRDTRYRQTEFSIDHPAEGEESVAPSVSLPDKRPGIEQQLIQRDRAAFIRRAIDTLPEKQRAAVLLHKYQELDYDEIAKILQCSESALKSLLFRAYEALRVQLAPLVAQSQQGIQD